MRPSVKNAWIVGAGGGIGGAITESLSRVSRNLHLCDRAPINDLTELSDGLHGSWHTHQFDLAHQSQAQQFAMAASALTGRPDLLVHAAGEVSSVSVEEARPDEVDSLLRNNISSFVYSAQAFRLACDLSPAIPKMIVVVGSNAANEARPNQPIYAATKASIRSLVASLAVAWADIGISVIALEPGTVLVERNSQRIRKIHPNAPLVSDRPSGQLLLPSDLADFLCSVIPFGPHLTGRSIVIDGGSTLRGRT